MLTSSRGYTINYTVDGDGPALVLVAGTLCAAQHWRDFGYVTRLAEDWHVINIDPLGHGASDAPHDADSYEAAGVTSDLVAVLDAEGVDSATVWGYSRGGWLACNLASRYPDRVDRIVVAAYAMNAHEEEVARVLEPLASYLRRGDWSGVWAALAITDREFQQMIESTNDRLAVAAAIAGSMRPTRFVDPASIRCPATYYVGSQDWIVPHVRADVEALGATMDVIEGQGHIGTFFVSTDRALDVVATRLRA
jgi:pimeloyl-ACP methyl ester carboxylesterase